MAGAMEHVLSGIRVLDLSRALAGPSCTRMLAEMGAEVIKVEAAPNGDLVRGISKLRGNDRSLYYIQQNLGKKSVCVNLRDPRGMAIVAALVPKVDVVVENFKPGTMAEMGLGYERLREMRKDIILCSISALGQSGPLARLPGYDFIAQAYSGVTSMIGEANGTPYIRWSRSATSTRASMVRSLSLLLCAIAIAPATGSIWTSACSTFTTTVTRSAFISSAAVKVSSSRAARDRISTISRQPGYSKRPADGS